MLSKRQCSLKFLGRAWPSPRGRLRAQGWGLTRTGLHWKPRCLAGPAAPARGRPHEGGALSSSLPSSAQRFISLQSEKQKAPSRRAEQGGDRRVGAEGTWTCLSFSPFYRWGGTGAGWGSPAWPRSGAVVTGVRGSRGACSKDGWAGEKGKSYAGPARRRPGPGNTAPGRAWALASDGPGLGSQPPLLSGCGTREVVCPSDASLSSRGDRMRGRGRTAWAAQGAGRAGPRGSPRWRSMGVPWDRPGGLHGASGTRGSASSSLEEEGSRAEAAGVPGSHSVRIRPRPGADTETGGRHVTKSISCAAE